VTDQDIQPSRETRRSGRRATGNAEAGPARSLAYRQLINPFQPQTVFSADQINNIHATALRVLETLGIKVLLPEARAIFKAAGALVDEDTLMVRIGQDIVEQALASAPTSFWGRAGNRNRDVNFAQGALNFIAGCGAPNVTDTVRGRRPGSLADYADIVRLTQHFDVLHMQGPFVEPQDIPTHLRHYAMTRAQLTLSDKFPFVYARGTAQVLDGFEMIRLAHGLTQDAFEAEPHTYTVINTNSPRQLDLPMSQGIIDFARAKQISIITPFCLAGAMAPITVAGALTLQHAEALAGLTLAQLTRKGAPVVYGSFSSNVDMKSGAPLFGTPEHMKATIGTGQLARHIGLPWRAGGGSASNAPDVQAAQENGLSLWGSVLAGATVLIHAAGWLEGGLSISFEKLITDVDVLQTIAEMCTPTPGDDAAIAYAAIEDVQPGGHFFATEHTMSRYKTAFYEPLVTDATNFGTWTEAGALTATDRARGMWQQVLRDFRPPAGLAACADLIDPFIARRTAEGGAPPLA
jgi:trimethylamine---corrinoid protein Co-methyltransferase